MARFKQLHLGYISNSNSLIVFYPNFMILFSSGVIPKKVHLIAQIALYCLGHN